MKYQLEYHPNPDCLTIHVGRRVTDEMIESFSSRNWDKDKQSGLVRDLFRIEGIAEVTLHQYEIEVKKARIHLKKGTVFEWDDSLSKISLTIQKHLCPQEKMVEKTPPIKPSGYYSDVGISSCFPDDGR